jgi:uncharacterized protein (TIGR02646 family)
MRIIAKGREPAGLTQHRATEFADYDNYQDKDTLRACLVTEQRGICCYCMRPIRPTREAMKIEHWHPQEDPAYADEQLVYANLLGSCLGGDGQRDSVKHCDTAKGMKLLSRNPANPDHHVEELVRFDSQGKITSTDADFDLQLNTVLNLNAAHLKNSRIAELVAFHKAFKIRGTLTRQQLNKIIGEWSGASHANALRPYCGVVVYWARKRLARM